MTELQDLDAIVMEGYRRAKTELLNKEHTLIAPKDDDAGCSTVVVYTDGSAKGADQARDKRGFAGWGFYFRSHSASQKPLSEGSRYGNLFNATAKEAELRALLEGLKFNKFRSHFEVVTDCASVVTGLVDLKNNEEDTIHEQESDRLAVTKLWRDIRAELYGNDKIASLKVRWVRAHALDQETVSLIDPSQFQSKEAKKIISDCLGNYRADLVAELGSLKAVRGALYYFKGKTIDDHGVDDSIKTCRKNFFSSQFCREEAVGFLSRQPTNFVDPQIIESILDSRSLAQIDEARMSPGANTGQSSTGSPSCAKKADVTRANNTGYHRLRANRSELEEEAGFANG